MPQTHYFVREIKKSRKSIQTFIVPLILASHSVQSSGAPLNPRAVQGGGMQQMKRSRSLPAAGNRAPGAASAASANAGIAAINAIGKSATITGTTSI